MGTKAQKKKRAARDKGYTVTWVRPLELRLEERRRLLNHMLRATHAPAFVPKKTFDEILIDELFED